MLVMNSGTPGIARVSRGSRAVICAWPKKGPQKIPGVGQNGDENRRFIWGFKGNCMGVEVVYKISGSLRKMMGII